MARFLDKIVEVQKLNDDLIQKSDEQLQSLLYKTQLLAQKVCCTDQCQTNNILTNLRMLGCCVLCKYGES